MAAEKKKGVCSLAAWRVLMSPVRSEIAEALRLLGTASIAEVATVLDRPADSLYRHVGMLQKHHFVEEVGFRKRGRHVERLLRMAADDFEPDVSHASAARVNRAVHDTANTLLKAMARTVRDAALAGAIEAGAARNISISYELGWLTPEAFQQVRKLVGRLKVIMDRSKLRQEGNLYLTLAMACPVVRKRGASLNEEVLADASRPPRAAVRRAATTGAAQTSSAKRRT